ncbi:MAG: ATP-binding protein [Muribaculaceae bacterium]|nr:ATP-binding protein [Muribaculaceae bacterium]
MEKPRNPFILGHKINRPYFCDRYTEQKELTSAIINGRNVVMISPRRMGKTSLIYVSLNDSEEIREDEYQVFFIDILQTNSLNEFTYLLGKDIFNTLVSKSETKVRGFLAALKSLKGTFGFDAINGTPTFNLQLGDIKHPEYTLEEIFGYIEQSEKPVIIVIDEFQQITKYPEKNTEAILRSHMQRLSNATFIFAGSEHTLLQEMFVSAKRPFYNSAEIMYLGPIDEDTYVEFAQGMFADREREIEEEPIHMASRLFDGNTFYMQRTMNGAFADTAMGNICGMDTVRRSIHGMIAANETIYREILSNISINQKNVLYAIAREKVVTNPMGGDFLKRNSLPSASSVQSAIQKLQKAGIVIKTDKGYSMTDALFRIFINGLYFIPEV